MRAIVTGEGRVELREVPMPRPKPSEVLVRVRAAGLNRADLMVAAGARHGAMGGAGTILGLEFAGEVAEVGSEVTGVKTGDRVMCSGAGGYAEYAVADMGRVLPLPDANLGFAQAATLPVALQTMHDAVMTNGRLAAGESVLVLGASSGVGLMALRIARLMGAGTVIGTSTNEPRRAKLGAFGADLAVDTSAPGWVDAVLEATGGKGVNLAIDQISGALTNETLKATAILGRIVNVGRLGGAKATFDFDLHALRRITYVGVTFRTRSVAEVREIVRRMRADLWPHLEAGALSLPIDRTFPLEQAADALDHMRANAHFGKIVLTMD